MFSTCKALIRTLPLLRHDADRPEEPDTGTEDHAADESRYACLSALRGGKGSAGAGGERVARIFGSEAGRAGERADDVSRQATDIAIR